ncbi:inactive pancreatic lipase-related protein 1-like [Leptidea sinapis]|uniref:inactive pancreatic lipase-related protein 1-like n=1 Tax=Leptidea sinapis TaxID=189913 RepID=UPI0021C3C557|nr:inactive pancreatic lipase-related protein 1-like [Leptidea sinapis]
MKPKTFMSFVVQLIVLRYQYGEGHEADPGYGRKWLHFIDEGGQRHIMNFSSIPEVFHSLTLGHTILRLYTRNNKNTAERLKLPRTGDLFIKSRYFNAANDVKIITHGWFSSNNASWLEDMKDTFLQDMDLNVITVDWSSLAQNILYPASALATRHVGKKVARLINALKRSYSIKSDMVHLIGHSLGAHVMGYAGSYTQDDPVFRITGLDPARPLFEVPKLPDKYILDKSDAVFVDVIHTDAGVLGFSSNCGHVDFFPNGGKPIQPGCTGNIVEQEACSHGRSCDLFVESISYASTDNGFTSRLCESWDQYINGLCKDAPEAKMGYPVSPTVRGTYYLYTSNQTKYSVD